MASHTPGVSTERFRHRITNIKLTPPTATRDISLKILIDGQEAHRLPAILRDASLCWDKIPHCEVDSNSRVEIRVYEKHFLWIERVGTLTYSVADVTGLSEASLDCDTKRFKAVLSFPTLEATKEAPATALAVAQAMKQKSRPLEQLGPTRAVLKAILDGGEMVSELHPAAKIVVGFCKIAWQGCLNLWSLHLIPQTLEKQEQCDANVEKLVVDLANMLPEVASTAEHRGGDEESNRGRI
ncbi:hypothetical protein BDV93DRAFT_510287 [Ceratobasidium sp. AG-I]|nr:hypothetical protein BDV93DRAFT_510287 [Ceratobasidium sp. AG-I]